MKKLSILFILAVWTSVAQATVVPSSQGQAPSTDPYVTYQWGFVNSGQTLIQDKDDIHSRQIIGPMDIGWSRALDLRVQREVIVAVIDSGLDVEHEDLVGRIALNSQECVNGKIPTGPTGDPDKNGFEGDCMGWNFAAPKKERARFVDDELGHGTHVAGIMAAALDNGKGISGVSNRIRILPIKVYGERDTKGNSLSAFADRLVSAFDYAIKRRVDVINLSLGWPLIAHTQKLQETINRAIEAGIVIVAAAGNDSHNMPIYPCAHPGVVCVGSLEISGEPSRFTNYGGHVDLFAPGSDILSLWPMSMVSELFGAKGYELRSGTSQAAPHVAALAALLKGIFPDAGRAEIRARLMAASQLATSREGIRLDQINYSKALLETPRETVKIAFKGVDHIVLNEAGQGSFEVTVLNLTSENLEIPLHGKSLSPEVQLTLPKSVSLKGYAEVRVRVSVQIENRVKASALMPVVFETPTGGIFKHQLVLAQLPQGRELEMNEVASNLATVRTLSAEGVSPEYYVIEKMEKGIRLKILQISGFELKVAAVREFSEIEGFVKDSPLLRFDINQDGQLDYWITAAVKNEKGEIELRYYLLDSQLKPLLGGTSHFTIRDEGVLEIEKMLDPNSIQLGKLETAWGELLIPTFWREGFIPEKDRDPDYFHFEPQRLSKRLYFIELSGAEAVPRLFNNCKFLKDLRRNLSLNFEDDVVLIGSLVQRQTGMLRVLVATGVGIRSKYWTLELGRGSLLGHEATVSEYDNQGLDLTRQVLNEGYMSVDGRWQKMNFVTGIFNSFEARVVGLGDRGVLGQQKIDTEEQEESMVGAALSLMKDGELISFLEGETKLLVQGQRKGKTFSSERSLFRSSVLPGHLFSQRFNPILAGRGERPALLVDNSAVFQPTVFAFELGEDLTLDIPLRTSFSVPKGCRILSPAVVDGQSVAPLLCEKTLTFLPLN